MVFFTIITSTLNSEETIPRLLDSLASQTFRDFNWIVQDGESKDGTMAIAESYRTKLPEILSNSEKDNGVYDAWNRALAQFSNKLGEWIIFLGADDYLASNHVLYDLSKQLCNCSDDKIFAIGQITVYKSSSKPFFSATNDIRQMSSVLPYANPFYHAGILTRSSFLKAHNFDSSFKILGDYDFFCKYWSGEQCALQLKCLISHVALGGLSASDHFSNIRLQESYNIRKKYFFIKYYKSIFFDYINSLVSNSIKQKIPSYLKSFVKKFFIKF